MVSYQKLKHVVGDKLLVEAVCLSTDTKPTENIADSSKLTEQDTGKKYLFNGGTWYNVTDEMPIDIEEPTLITLTQDTDIIDLATKAYNGEVLVQWYVDEMMGDTMPLPPPLLLPCSPLVIPKNFQHLDTNDPFIIGFAANIMYVLGNRPDDSLASDMKPAALVCVLRSTPNMHITKDDATVCGVLTDMSASSFTYLSFEDFSEKYLAPKFLVTPLYSKQQQTHPVAIVMLLPNEFVVTFYDGKTQAQLNQFLIDEGASIGSSEIPEGYDYWTVDDVDEESITPHYSDEDIMNMSVDGDLTFYGWGGFTVSYYDGLTGNLISTEHVTTNGTPQNVPGETLYWFFDVANPAGDTPSVDPTIAIISSDTSYWGWETDPREQ